VVEVADDGGGGPIDAGVSGGGHGLVGMRERALLLGGELAAGPRPGGGFIVSARLPLTQARS
jgi:signal transduction histidine kinase